MNYRAFDALVREYCPGTELDPDNQPQQSIRLQATAGSVGKLLFKGRTSATQYPLDLQRARGRVAIFNIQDECGDEAFHIITSSHDKASVSVRVVDAAYAEERDDGTLVIDDFPTIKLAPTSDEPSWIGGTRIEAESFWEEM